MRCVTASGSTAYRFSRGRHPSGAALALGDAFRHLSNFQRLRSGVFKMRQGMQADLIGTSLAIADLKAEVERVARSDAKVLITGESGVGKEIVARAIYAASPRAGAAFV